MNTTAEQYQQPKSETVKALAAGFNPARQILDAANTKHQHTPTQPAHTPEFISHTSDK